MICIQESPARRPDARHPQEAPAPRGWSGGMDGRSMQGHAGGPGSANSGTLTFVGPFFCFLAAGVLS